MSCDTIKFKVFQDLLSKNVSLEVYRPYGINDEWMRIDVLNDMTVDELKCLTKYLVETFNKASKKNKP